jgi:hypothetical protein
MLIEISKKNQAIVTNALSDTIELIQEFAKSENKEQSDKKRLVLLDLIFRQYPNLNAISILLENYFKLNNQGNNIPIGLILRCGLEDMMYAIYLITFQDDPDVLEREIIVQSKNSISEYIEYVIFREPEYWKCSPEKKQSIQEANKGIYESFKKDNPVFFDDDGKLKNFRKLRREVPNYRNYFNSENIEKQGPCSMYKRLKTVDLDFSYIYFEYKFYCLFEHYSFSTRKVLELNEFTFGHLAVSIEFILRGIVRILGHLRVDSKFIEKINIINKSMALNLLQKNE